MNSGSRFYSLVAPALLIAIAMLQMYNARVHDLSAWKGGGFGMFSTVDSPSARFVKIYLVTPDGAMRVQTPVFLKREERLLRTFPTPSNLDYFCDKLAGLRWIRDQQFKDGGEEQSSRVVIRPTYEFETGAYHEKVNVDSIRLELWRFEFSRPGLEVSTYHQTTIEKPAAETDSIGTPARKQD